MFERTSRTLGDAVIETVGLGVSVLGQPRRMRAKEESRGGRAQYMQMPGHGDGGGGLVWGHAVK